MYNNSTPVLKTIPNNSTDNHGPTNITLEGGKSHLASVRYVGGKAYNIRNPLYDPDRVRTDVEFLSRYLRDRRAMSEKLPARELLLDSGKSGTLCCLNDDEGPGDRIYTYVFLV